MKEIRPLAGPLHAEIPVPGSKSISNRALVLAALSQGSTTLSNLQFSDDSRRMLDCLKNLGYAVSWDEEAKSAVVEGRGGEVPADEAELHVGNAGTAARFLPCLAALGSGRYRFVGDERMSSRPMQELLGVLGAQGALIEGSGYPFSLKASGLRGGEAAVDISRSTQFASGLLMAAPYAKSPLKLKLGGDRQQIPYIEMTAEMMKHFGVEVERGGGGWTAPLKPYVSPGGYAIEPDLSGAAYFFAAAALLGGRVTVAGTRPASLQGDIRFLQVLKHMGCEFFEDPEGLTVEKEPGRVLKGVDVDMNAFSDQALTLAALAPFCDRPSSIRNIAHARKQESDRVHAIASNLKRLGAQVEEREDGVTITPGPLKAGVIETFGDHRVAMAFSLLGLKVPGVVIDNEACVAKTFESYWDAFGKLYAA